jgi:hypothetical protein
MKYIKHFIVITKHKWYVMQECFKRGLYWQGITHDLSKYSWTEFCESARFFQGTRTPIGEAKKIRGYSEAWLHHKGHNKHHWEYWTDYTKGELTMCKIPMKYIIEMVCDMIGASKAYNKGKYDPMDPYRYFDTHRDNFLMLERDKETLAILLVNLK